MQKKGGGVGGEEEEEEKEVTFRSIQIGDTVLSLIYAPGRLSN